MDISMNAAGTFTLYQKGKKVMTGSLEDVVARIRQEPAAPPPRPKKMSRSARFIDACERSLAALGDLESVREEYQEWRDNLPENLAQSALGEKLDEVADMDIQSAIDIVEEASGMDLPQGFGRD